MGLRPRPKTHEVDRVGTGAFRGTRPAMISTVATLDGTSPGSAVRHELLHGGRQG
ncbi:hypothetical protein [Pseudonocardia kunmingensis]|uniref:hypothetical protein n=1 Tax=Pseudonocardia kunmingensis TaxID=630975 RepID=UPI001478FC01|nr:hypothetical protein [Pseudonocardia kunmingensis]